MEILGKILGSGARVKVMRLFLLNKGKGFKNEAIARRSRVNADMVRKEVKLLSSIGFIKKRGKELFFDPSFKYSNEVEDLLVNSDTLNKQDVASNLRKVGRIKLLVVSGIFIKNNESRVDLLIVGDGLKKSKIEEEMRKLEAEIGTELVYAFFPTKEFIYRLNMYDKLVRDILDFPHEILLQAKELNLQVARHA